MSARRSPDQRRRDREAGVGRYGQELVRRHHHHTAVDVWRASIQDTPCPTCHVEAGAPCIGVHNQVRASVHRSRIEAARRRPEQP